MPQVCRPAAAVVCRTDDSIVCPAEVSDCHFVSMQRDWIPESFFFASVFFGIPFLVGSLIPEIMPTSEVRPLPILIFFLDFWIFRVFEGG